MGDNIINLLVPTDVGSPCCGQHTVKLLPLGGDFSICRTAQSIRLGVLSTILEEELKVLDFV